jgi:asparagine synthase (glutamine-hydrolysing)
VCGICGFAYAPASNDAERRVRSMAQAMLHRGPDDEGFLVEDSRVPGLALGMRRLSIIDLPGGHQPVWNETHDVAVVFNGELYNYRELRERLTLAGHRFQTKSDTEILVHGWEEWGEDLLDELRGMFSFALLDLRKHFATVPLVFLGRDPLGIKPLYYSQTEDGFAFASELRALLASGCVPRTLSSDALTSYLLFGSVSEPLTLVENVFSLPPGHRLLLHVPDRRRTPRARPWWDPRRSAAARDPRRPRNFITAVPRVRAMLMFQWAYFFRAASTPVPSPPLPPARKKASRASRSRFPIRSMTKPRSHAGSPMQPAQSTPKFPCRARTCSPASTKPSSLSINPAWTASTPTSFPGPRDKLA